MYKSLIKADYINTEPVYCTENKLQQLVSVSFYPGGRLTSSVTVVHSHWSYLNLEGLTHKVHSPQACVLVAGVEGLEGMAQVPQHSSLIGKEKKRVIVFS